MAKVEMFGKNFYFVDPNKGNEHKSNDADGVALEDLSIFVDLVVSIPERSFDGSGTKDGTKITMHADMSPEKFSFQQGSSVELHSGVSDNVTLSLLTTAPYDVTTFGDIPTDTKVTPECFGMTSVNIDYKDYAVPEVTINFVDIRGVSLFGAEELRHGVKLESSKGSEMQGGVDNSIAGSFFKSFFMFPYPRYTMYVKGFYGSGTTYELTCSDFKASFDCNSGNFNVTVKFIGFAYSLFGDVALNALIAAPYEMTYGRQYWAEKAWKIDEADQAEDQAKVEEVHEEISKMQEEDGKKDGGENSSGEEKSSDEGSSSSDDSSSSDGGHSSSVFDDRAPDALPTLAQLIDEWNKISKYVNEIVKNSSENQTYETAQQVSSAKSACEGVANYIKNQGKLEGNDWVINQKVDDSGKANYEAQIEELKKIKKSVEDYCKSVQESKSSETTVDDNGTEQTKVDATNVDGFAQATGISKKQAEFMFKVKDLKVDDMDVDVDDDKTTIKNYKQLDDALNTLEGEDVEKTVSDAKESSDNAASSVAEAALGFKPSVNLIKDILLAHLDTLNHCIYKVAGSVDSSRTMQSLGVENVDLNLKNGSGVGAFPRVLKTVTENGEDKTTEVWLGDTCSDAPEVKFIEGLLAGIKQLQEIIARNQPRPDSGNTANNNENVDNSTDDDSTNSDDSTGDSGNTDSSSSEDSSSSDGGSSTEATSTTSAYNEATGYFESTDEQATKFGEDANTDIKLSLYKYIKNLYDRWLSGMNEEDYSFDRTKPHFHFIDCYYNDIGNQILANLDTVCSDLIDCFNQSSFSMISYMDNVMSNLKFALQTVQNFLGVEDMKNLGVLFDPIPTNTYLVTRDENTLPHFVYIYHYDSASKLDDGFDVHEETLPQGMKGSTYPVPCFAVNYGQQNQNYFKSIDVNMDTPMITEQSICAQFKIAELSNPASNDAKMDTDGEKNVSVVGQDMYTIYSNNSYTCVVKMMGCAYIQPLMYFQLNNVPLFHGAYLIEKVSHSITPGNMETTFTGVKMSKVASPIVKNWLNVCDNTHPKELLNGGGGGSGDDGPQLSNATIDMNCQYTTFPVDGETGGIGKTMSNAELNMTMSQYEASKGSTFSSKWMNSVGITNKSMTMRELLAGVMNGEAGGGDDTTRRSHLTVLYNRWVKKGYNFCKVLLPSQHAYKAFDSKHAQKHQNCLKTVNEIFLKSPGILVNQQAKVINHSLKEYTHKKWNGQMSKTKAVSLDDVQKETMYCTWRGYDLTWHKLGKTRRESGKNSKGKPCIECTNGQPGYWHEKVYNYQAIYDSKNMDSDTVFSGEDNKVWQASPPPQQAKANTAAAKNDALREGLLSAVKQTLQYCSDETYQKTAPLISAGRSVVTDKGKQSLSDTNHADFWIYCKKGSVGSPGPALMRTFDVLVNGYSSYCQEIHWVVSNDTSSAPDFLYVKLANGTAKRGSQKFIIRKSNTTASPIGVGKPTVDKTAVHTNFLKTMKKYYPNVETTYSDRDLFRKDCKNFSGWTASKNTDNIAQLFKTVKVAACDDTSIPGGGNLTGFAGKVTNANMKKVLANVDSIISGEFEGKVNAWNSKPKNKNKSSYPHHATSVAYNGHKEWKLYTEEYNGCCTSGPTTWYGRAGISLNWWGSESTKTYAGTSGRMKGKLTCVSTINGHPGFNISGLRPGDVATIYPNSSDHHHGEMWTSKDWRSDTIQSSAGIDVYKSSDTLKPYIAIWRRSDFQEPGMSIK